MVPPKEHAPRVESDRAPVGADERRARSTAAQCQLESFSIAMWEPMEQLPVEDFVYPQKPHCNPLRMQFGLAVKMESLYEYAFKRRLVPAGWRDDEDREYVVFEAAVQELDRLCGTKTIIRRSLIHDTTMHTKGHITENELIRTRVHSKGA